VHSHLASQPRTNHPALEQRAQWIIKGRSGLSRNLKKIPNGLLSIAMVPAKEMGNQVPLPELVCGGVTTIPGKGFHFPPEDLLIFIYSNIAERCPGEQTNNRAELIVREHSAFLWLF